MKEPPVGALTDVKSWETYAKVVSGEKEGWLHLLVRQKGRLIWLKNCTGKTAQPATVMRRLAQRSTGKMHGCGRWLRSERNNISEEKVTKPEFYKNTLCNCFT